MILDDAITLKQLNIALVSDWYYPRNGGIEYAINALARHLVSLGHRVDIITKRTNNLPIYEQDGPIKIVRIDNKGPTDLLLTRSAYKTLKKQIKEGNYHLVHGHGIDSPMALGALMISRQYCIKNVMTNHSYIGSDGLRIPKRLILKPLLNNADAVIAVSSVVSEDTKRFYSGSIHIVPNGIDDHSPNGSLKSIDIPSEQCVITTVSRLIKRKAVNDFVRMALDLIKKRPNAFFVLVGGGPLQNKLEHLVRREGQSHHFLFVGQASRATVLKILEQSNIFVLTSKREAFGIVILEAFYKKVPVIVRKDTGAATLIHHAKTGFLAEDTADFVSYVEQLMDTPKLGESLAQLAYKDVANYQWDKIAKQTEAIYKDLVGA